MKNAIKIPIIIIFVIILTSILVLCGVRYYFLHEDTQTLSNLFEYKLPLLREYGTSDVIEIQEIQEQRMKEEFETGMEEGTYTITNPYIIKNPYDRSVLSAYIAIPTEQAAKYTYTVVGKTEDTNFSYSSDEYEENPILPVVSLYNNYENEVDVTLEFEDGTSSEYKYMIQMEEDIDEDIDDGINIDVIDSNAYNEVLDGNIIFDGSFNGYDTNGDLRFTGFSTYRTNIMKLINGKMLVGYDLEAYKPEEYYSPRFFEMNAMGKFNADYILKAPRGYGFHHDMAYDESTNQIYALVSQESSDVVFSEEEYGEGGIAIYDATTLKLKDFFNITDQIPSDIIVGKSTKPYDIHFNGIDYNEERDEIILSSRSTSQIYGVNVKTHEITWVLGDPKYIPEELQDVALDPVGDNIEYTRGQHSVYIMDNSYYQSYYDEGKLVISVFDNQSHEGGYVKLNGEEVEDNEEWLEDNSRIMTYAIDFENNTFELINKIQLTANSPYVSNVYDTENYMVASITMANTMNITDFEGNIAVEITGLTSTHGYRGYIYSKDEISSTLSF